MDSPTIPTIRVPLTIGTLQVLLWDMVGYRLARRLSGHFNTVLSCCFSPDGALVATASRDTRVIVWDPDTGDWD